MNPLPTSLLRIRALLGTALVLSVGALLAFLTRPAAGTSLRPTFTSTESGVRIDAKVSHPAVTPYGTEFFAEYTVTLPEGVVPSAQRVSIAVVLDRSGSMNGVKLVDAQLAVNRLVDLLQDGDQLALVDFGSEVESTRLYDISEATRAELHARVNQLTANGGTNISAGLERGRELLTNATGARRLILISDGQPTEGLTASFMLAGAVGRIHDEQTTVTALGVGNDYDGTLLSLLSERGGGMLGHLQDVAQLEEVLGKELAAARLSVARNVELTLTADGADFVDAPGRNLVWSPQGQRLFLADLRPGLPTRVVVRLRSRPDAEDFAAVDARVSWSALSGKRSDTKVPLEVAVIDDVNVVNRGRDESVFARGVTAMGTVRMLAAASAYERGDDALGSSLLDEARGVFGMSADALAGQTEVENVRTRLRSAGAVERKTFNYGLEKKTLVNFGRENEGY
ncbi:MAG: VWA domain-containing protein [Archangium sp.]